MTNNKTNFTSGQNELLGFAELKTMAEKENPELKAAASVQDAEAAGELI